ncbi:MAG: hypothetical protein LBT81_00710 [Helicobacteraceae bacterium]|nr:hypothetical protein [Helicobacteraceae bacterium]
MPVDEDATLAYIEHKTANTPERVETYMRFNEALSGRAYRSSASQNMI